jgi:hypothetical protein
MKLGVVYNLFDGEELLKESIKSVRDNVDFIVVVYQTISNFGQINNQSEIECKKLKQEGLIDELYYYTPVIEYLDNNDVFWESGCNNELAKRNIGLNICKENGCTHLLMMDCDEFYTDEQFNFALFEIVEGNYDTSFCQMVTYYKEPFYELRPKETYYVPFIIKIKESTEYKLFNSYPIQIDQTRKTDVGNCIVFSRDEIEMHHFSYVRKDITKKYSNSSSIFPKEEIEDSISRFNNFKLGNKAILLGQRIFDVVETKNIFNIEI